MWLCTQRRGAWQTLRAITLADCALTSLAPLAAALASCVAVESLSLMNNALCDLPHGVSAMLGSAHALTSLDLSFNSFATLPVDVRDATALQRLNGALESFGHVATVPQRRGVARVGSLKQSAQRVACRCWMRRCCGSVAHYACRTID